MEHVIRMSQKSHYFIRELVTLVSLKVPSGWGANCDQRGHPVTSNVTSLCQADDPAPTRVLDVLLLLLLESFTVTSWFSLWTLADALSAGHGYLELPFHLQAWTSLVSRGGGQPRRDFLNFFFTSITNSRKKVKCDIYVAFWTK